VTVLNNLCHATLQCCGFPLAAMWIRIQGAKQMRILADTDPRQTFVATKKWNSAHEKYTLCTVYPGNRS
jgi:hypothetical protein